MSLAPLPYLTPELSGSGGRIKDHPEDFRVDELPLYAPSGTGEHLYLRVRKRGATTQQLLSALGGAYGLPGHALGHAGLKDAQAVTTQWISLHTPADYDPARWPEGPWQMLEWSRHSNKLRPGHLRGNRFDILIRAPENLDALERGLVLLGREGYPNYFGPQRFGRDGGNAARGKALITNGISRRSQSQQARLMVNAYQAELFNRQVANRLRVAGSLARLYEGDLAVLHRNGASFLVDGDILAITQERADSGELSPSAALFGYRVPLAECTPGEWERAVLTEEGLALDDFRRFGKRDSPKGERRAVRVIPAELRFELASESGETVLRLRFTLPPGAYATSLLREIMKEPGLITPE